VSADDIRIVGPETKGANRGTYRAVWIGLDELQVGVIHPSAVAQLVANYHGVWPDAIINIDERRVHATLVSESRRHRNATIHWRLST
jgi:hypothetical protein